MWQAIIGEALGNQNDSFSNLIFITTEKDKDMEDRDGEKGPTCEHGENKDNGVWY